MRKFFKTIFNNNRYFLSFWLFIGGTILTVLFSAIGSTTTHSFWEAFKTVYWIFGNPFVVAILFVLFSKMEPHISMYFGVAFHVGTVGVLLILTRIGISGPDASMIACSALIAGLICYVVYIKKFKDKYKTSDEVDKIAETE